jgi:carbamoyltransferase
MGLASYGEPAYLDEFRHIVRGSGLGYELELDRFRHQLEGTAMTWDGGSPELPPLWGARMQDLLGPARNADEPLERRHHDIAASLQASLEDVVLGMLRELHEKTGLTSLCLAGGVALNCVVNGKITDETPFTDLYIQPAAYDGGTSVGAAYHVLHAKLGAPRSFCMEHAYWGPEYPPERMRAAVEAAGLPHDEMGPDKSIECAADVLADGGIVGWYQGRVEFGPRALGNRSILADPRRDDMQDILNARIKHREPFRPFAPTILEERTAEWFEKSDPSPFMLLTYPVRPDKRGQIPAPTHVDGTGRLQTVRRDQNERYYDLIRAFERRTGVPVLLNTSFNENEPICCTPEQAVDTFVRTRMDLLVLGDLVCEKATG